MTTKLTTRQAVQLPVEIAVEPAAPASPINAELAPTFAKGIYNSQQQVIVLGEKIGVGGEGTVYHIQGQADLVAKIYHEVPSAEKAEKLLALARLGTERLFKMSAWPVDVLRDRPGGNVIGFVMKKVWQAEEVHALHSPKSRLKKFPDASWAFLLHVATNIARAVATMHEHGFVIGDVNPKNILVTRQATVYLLDCDSFQFSSEGKTYRCEGGFPEYTPPELHGIPFSEVDRTQEHDCFGLAVVIFQLLFLGRHPYSGRFLGTDEMPLEKAIQERRFAYGTDAAQRQMQPPPGTLPFDSLPGSITTLLRRAFLELDRPNPSEWLAPLEQISKSLQCCKLHNGHHYFAELPTCPWCELEGRAGIRLFNFQFNARQQAGQFHLDEMLNELDHLEQIKQLPSATPATDVLLSRSALQYAQKRDMRFWTAIGFAILTGGFIGWWLDLSVAIWFLVGVATIARMIAKGNPETPLFYSHLLAGAGKPKVSLIEQTQARKKQAEQQLKRLEYQFWGAQDGDKSYFEQHKEIKSRLKEYENLPQRRAEQLQTIADDLQKKALAKHLKQHTFNDPRLAGLTPDMKSWLRERGITTAADLTSHRFKPTGNISQFQLLLDWRQQLVDDFQHTAPRTLPPEVRITVEQEIDKLKVRLEMEVSQSIASLRTLKPHLEEKWNHLLQPWTQTQRDIAQAEIDLEVIAKQNRVSPIIMTLVVVCLITSAFAPSPSRPIYIANRTGAVRQTDATSNSYFNTDATFNSYFNEGLQLISNEDYNRAKDVFMSAMPYVSLTSWDERYASFYHNLCYAKSKLKEGQVYLAYLERQITANPDRNDYQVQLIMLYPMEKQMDKVASHYRLLKDNNSLIAADVATEMKQHGIDLEALLQQKPSP